MTDAFDCIAALALIDGLDTDNPKVAVAIIADALRKAHKKGVADATDILLRDLDPERAYASWDDFCADLREQQDALRDGTGLDFTVFANPHSLKSHLRMVRKCSYCGNPEGSAPCQRSHP